MNNNTVVVASDSNYVWGVFLLLASMRKTGMNEPVLILEKDYTKEDISCLKQFSGVRFVEFPTSGRRNMTCSKPIAMLHADTEYITWVDCDGVFTNNCSKYLTAENGIHFRIRDKEENAQVFKNHYRSNDKYGEIPKHILEIWKNDISENRSPLFNTCGTACFISVHKKYRYLLEKWRDQIDKVLPEYDVGVVDKRSIAYFQTDESVLNSVLIFSNGVEKPGDYKLDKDPEAYYVHFILLPKPWKMWNSHTIKHFDMTVEIVEWALKNNLILPKSGKLPFSFRKKYKFIIQIIAKYSIYYVKAINLLRRIIRYITHNINSPHN